MSYQSLTDELRRRVDDRMKREYIVNPRYEEQIRGIDEQLAGSVSEEEQSKRRIQEDYDEQSRGLQQQHEKSRSMLQDRLANQGILRSGIAVGEDEELGKQYTQANTALTGAKTRGTEDIIRQFMNRRNELGREKGLAETDRAGSEVTFRDDIAREEATNESNKRFQEEQTNQLNALKEQILKNNQPVTLPTGAVVPPPPPAPPPPPPPRQPAPPPRPAPAPAIPATEQQAINRVKAQFSSPADVRAFQSFLKGQGVDPGPVDGVIGQKTINAFLQHRKNIGVYGTPYSAPSQIPAPTTSGGARASMI